jgi:ubiquinone/menaquinone biosynthesis C-methylase UbiE
VTTRSPDFDARAWAYDALRPAGDAWWRLFEVLVAEADLRGRKVLDVGCGTGRLLAALVERAHAKAWGVDASEEMLRVARGALPHGVGLRQGRAEQLPFRDGWFERLTMSLVVHLVDRPRAFAEARRVLGDDGRLAIATFAPTHFDTYWLNPWFPSIGKLDRMRFPTGDELRHELEEAGLGRVAVVPVSSVEEIDRETALARVRGRHISTFDLLPPDEVREGTARAERELPARVEIRLEQLVVVAAA